MGETVSILLKCHLCSLEQVTERSHLYKDVALTMPVLKDGEDKARALCSSQISVHQYDIINEQAVLYF